MEFSRPEYWSRYPFPSPGDLSNPGSEPRSPALQENSLPAESQGKPKYTGMGSLSFLQEIFPTQESNRGLLHCRRILYQLSSQGSFRNKVHSRCNMLESSPNHLPATRVHVKIVFYETGPWCQKGWGPLV